MASLLGVAVLFLAIALVSYALGTKGIAGLSMNITKVLVVVFVLLFAATLILGNTANL
jgi:uncharacterized membrane protein YtjA (UPF0391 family)